MKKFISLLLVVTLIFSCSFVSFAAFASGGTVYYIDSVSGDDSSSGTSESSAWKTVANIDGNKLSYGDKILFKRGGVYEVTNLTITSSGSVEEPIVISSYGEGKNARLNTNERAEILHLYDCSYVTVSELEFTAHNGGGIWIDTPNKASYGITLQNLEMHDMQNYEVVSRDDFANGAAAARACVMVKGLGGKHPGNPRAVDNLTIIGCEMYDVGNGILLWGSWNDEKDPWFTHYEDECEFYYNKNTLVKDCYLHDMNAEAVVVGICDGGVVTNCRIIDCCQGLGVDENGNTLYYAAAAWFWGAFNSTISHCEIAGQKNIPDGMTIDFDSYSRNCTYEYIYSHDNTRFMVNNSKRAKQYGNTVRYCLSVNDFTENQRSAFATGAGEYDFKFYNNTIVGCTELNFNKMYNSTVVNNIFISFDGRYCPYDMFEHSENNNTIGNNCYYQMIAPFCDLGSMNVNPGFAGTDWSNPESFKLSKDSPLIGAGVEVTEGRISDFYGDEITSTNIGCYGGDGEDVEYPYELFIVKIFRVVKQFFSTLKILIQDELFA